MRRTVKRTIVILIAIALIIAAILLVRHRKSELASLAMPSIRPIPVHIKTAVSGKLPIIEHYLGIIEPVAEAVLSAQTTGYLVSIRKDVGERLITGESVAEIDNRLPGSQKSAIEAQLAGAQEELEVKKTMRNRRTELLKNKVIPRESFDEANLAYELVFSRVQRLKQELEASNVSLSFSSIRSLFDGVITERMKDPGDMVMPGSSVFRIEDTSKGYKILVRLPQETVAQLPENASLKLINNANTIDANVYRIHPAIINGNLATIEIRVPERPFGFPSYGTVGVDLIVGTPEGLVVSSDCILEQETGALVFVVPDHQTDHQTPDQTILKVPVNILGRNGTRAVVEGALPAGTYLAAGPESLLLQLSRNGRIVPISGGEK